MSDIVRNRFDYNREKRVLINLILNTEFCEQILPVIRKDYFDAKYASSLIDWVEVYYESYGVAPKAHINDMFDEYGKKLDSDVHTQIGNVLEHLSDVIDTEVHNIKYLIDSANDLFREKHVELQNKTAEAYLEVGDVAGAEQAMLEQYVGIDGSTKEFIAFNDSDFMSSVVRSMIEQQDPENAFFRFSGRLGDFLGPIDQGWFIAYLAPAKRGKTTYMLDAAIDSIRQKKNTIIVSLEMPEKQLMARYAMAVTGSKPEMDPYTVMVPIMDCRHNQTCECELNERVGAGQVYLDDGLMPYENAPDWTVCTVCRTDNALKNNFEPTAWKVPVEKETISEGDYLKKLKRFNRLFGKYGRIIHIPSKTATTSDIRAKILELETKENFIPDVIVLDYADLIKPDSNTGVKRHDLDDIWEELRGWGQESHVLIISASQTNRLSAEVKYVKDIHVAEDYSKIAKLDIAIGLCQSDEMKEMGIMNINKVAHRHKEYVQSHVCAVLQEMSHMQSSLDSEFCAL